MGVSYGVYLGPYLKVPTYQKSESVTSYRCSASCGFTRVDKTTRFCPNCGQAVVSGSSGKVVTAVPRPWDLDDKWSEELWVPESAHSAAAKQGYVTWLANQRGFGQTYGRDEALGDAQVSDPMRVAGLAKAAAAWADLIVAAEAKFGVKVELCWGVVSYAN